jgi:UDP-N-acetylmuramyl pentapeptide phosphotransferase/UDP-N-acetylglucosamine-1-phosphate transferase
MEQNMQKAMYDFVLTYKYLLVFLVSLSFFAFLIPKKKALLRVAGPTIVMAVLIGLGVGLAYNIGALNDRSLYLLVGSALFFMVGLMDDLGIFRLWWHRLVGQILVLSTMIPIVASLRAVSSLPSVFASLTNGFALWLGYMIAPLWFLAVINLFLFLKNRWNLIGMLSLAIFCLLFLLSQRLGNLQLAFASLSPAGAILTFLVYNRLFSRLPLGSCGAMYIGFFIAAISIML